MNVPYSSCRAGYNGIGGIDQADQRVQHIGIVRSQRNVSFNFLLSNGHTYIVKSAYYVHLWGFKNLTRRISNFIWVVITLKNTKAESVYGGELAQCQCPGSQDDTNGKATTLSQICY